MESHEAIDVSNFQGNIDFSQVDRDIVIMKASQGTTFLDPYVFQNYDNAKHKNGKLVGLYHFANGEDPVAEANWFLQCAQPIEQFDVFCLDYEIHLADPISWCTAFLNHIHDAIGVWPIIYMNRSTLAGFNWNGILANCGLWIADPDHNPDDGAQSYGHAYVIHQYGEGGVPGISGLVDLDRVWLTEERWKMYGYNYAPPTPTPVPQPVVTIQTVTETSAIAPKLTTVNDPKMAAGTSKVTQQSVPGIETKTYTVTLTDGVETSRILVSDVVTKEPVDQVTTVGTKVVKPSTSDFEKLIAAILKLLTSFEKKWNKK